MFYFIISVFAVTTAVALSTALFGVRATDTGFTAFLCLIQIIHDTGYDTKEYNNDYCIFHNYLLSAYSAFSFLLVFIMRATMTATIAATAIRPPIAAPMLRVPPVTIVPMV